MCFKKKKNQLSPREEFIIMIKSNIEIHLMELKKPMVFKIGEDIIKYSYCRFNPYQYKYNDKQDFDFAKQEVLRVCNLIRKALLKIKDNIIAFNVLDSEIIKTKILNLYDMEKEYTLLEVDTTNQITVQLKFNEISKQIFNFVTETEELLLNEVDKHFTDKTIHSNGSIIPNDIIEDISFPPIISICKQINATYENNLFDCCSLMMRKLLENLLEKVFEKNGLGDEIKKDNYYIELSKIIARVDERIGIEEQSKKILDKAAKIGNYSAHKLFYICKKSDIDNIKDDYRIIIQELLLKSGFCVEI